MSSTALDEAIAVFDDLACHAAEPSELWSTGQRLDQLERIETLRRLLPALEHHLLNQLGHALPEELGAKLSRALADRLRISRVEASRRIHEADDLGARQTLTGQPLAPRLQATAAKQQEGKVGSEQVRVIREFLHRLPAAIDAPTREKAEADLAEIAAQYRPEQVRRYAARLAAVLNPDGTFTDRDRARCRGLTLGPQGIDGMSRLSGWLTPEARAGLDAVLAKWAAPGMCNPADQSPTVDGTPSETTVQADIRSGAQRNHDALNTMIRSVLMSGELGSHHGLPVTIIATARLQDLHAQTGLADTGGGTVLPIPDLIRMATHANHYLLLFDQANRCELYKGRTTRLATKEQRLVLHATDRGCTRPGCDVPGYLAEVHHVKPWATGGATDITNLTLACGPDNRLVEEGGWTTRKRPDGRTQWIPPPHLDTGQPRTNDFHRPEKDEPERRREDERPYETE